MGKTAVGTRLRRRSGRPARSAPVFPAQRRAAQQKAATLAKAAGKAAGKASGKRPTGKLPRPVVWLLWLLGAALVSVVVGFVLGFARPRARS